MNKFTKYISSQFKNPRGIGGIIISVIQNNINKVMYKNVVSIVQLQGNEKILDIGYGNGHLLEMFYEKKKVDMYGIDISNDAMKMATKRNGEAFREGRLHLTVGNCCQLPYEDYSFDVITSINSVYFWEDTEKTLAEIKRTLKVGRSFYNVVYTKEYLDTIKYTQEGYKKFEPEDLINCGKKAGFENIQIKRSIDGKFFVVIYTKNPPQKAYPCIGFQMEDAEVAYKHIEKDVVIKYGDKAYGHFLHTWDDGNRKLCICQKCGGYILSQYSEFHGIDDSYYLNLFPVSGAEEAERLNRQYDGYQIESNFGKKYLKVTNGRISW